MPARTVVIEKLSKFTGEHHEFLTPGEYTQLAGRAGRRGIDDRGYVVVLWNPFVPFEQVAGLASRRTYALTSSFRPTYNMAANLVRRYPPEQARHLLNLSFAQYHADRDVVALERQLEKAKEQLARARGAATHPAGDVGEYRRLVADLDAAKRTSRRGPEPAPRRVATGRRRPRTAARRQGGDPQAGPRPGRQPRARAHDGTRPGAARPARLPRPGPQGRDARPAPTVRASQPRVPAPGGRRVAATRGRHEDRDGHVGRREPGRRARRAGHRTSAAQGAESGRGVARGDPSRSHRARGRAPRTALGVPQREPRPAVRPRARRPRSLGLPRRLGPEPGGGVARAPQHRGRPRARRIVARGPARRPRPRRARGGRLVLHVPAPRSRRERAAAAAPLAEHARRASHPRASSRYGATSISPSATNGCPRRAGPTPGSPPRSTRGRRATTSPTFSKTRR